MKIIEKISYLNLIYFIFLNLEFFLCNSKINLEIFQTIFVRKSKNAFRYNILLTFQLFLAGYVVAKPTAS